MRYEFQKKKTGFVVCFYRSDGKADKKPIEADKKPIKADRQEIIINYIKEKGSITNKEARELLGLADSTIKRLLKGMVEQNLLIVEGERKARKYLLKNELEKQKK
ncbi:MAG: DeoR family transcriptional regulator [Lachnoclostridium sp.]